MPRSVKKKVKTPRGRKTPKQATRDGREEGVAGLQVPVPKRRRALFTSPEASASAGPGESSKTPPVKEKTLEEGQDTPRSTRRTRCQEQESEGWKTPKKTLPPDSKLNRTPRSKRGGESSCRTPTASRKVAGTPSCGLTTPKSSRRRQGEDVCGTPHSSRWTSRLKQPQPQCSISTLCAWYRDITQGKGQHVSFSMYTH